MKDLTVSNIDRQNVLNNHVALQAIQEYIGLSGMFFNEEYVFTKDMLSSFYNISESTIERYLESSELELKHNGYQVLKGKKLKEFKDQFGNIINITSKTPQLGIFNFRAFLNLGMLLVESEMAKALRSKILDIVIDSLNQKTGGSTKFINQRDEDFLNTILKEPHYRKEFTDALKDYLDLGNFKYFYYTDKIYECVFKENAKEYKRILKLEQKDNLRDTMYAEVLKLIASYETGLAHEMKTKSELLGRKLSQPEMDKLLEVFSNHPLYKPLMEDARTKMATRDYGFRRVFHDNLKQYINSISKSDFDRFLGEKSKTLEERIDENIDVFKRLKNR
ncbi:DNA-binding protein [Yeosuana sp.]|uniref:DNA-binding protein n=1 Tax=Yeosuana sp. TaxID=2529388 RepID=UPI004054F56B|tara:strand:- start:10627 stop:11628 length:1002 start_codon:yes stop_codon:yes gene_type:complete